MLRAGVMEDGQVRRPVTGTPQGGVISPVALQRLPAPARPGMGRARARGAGPLRRRSGGDVPVPAAGRGRAGAADGRCWPSSGWSRRRPRPGSCTWRREARDSTSSASTTAGALAGRRTGKRGVTFLARWPSDKAMQHARDRIRELTGRSRLLLPVEAIVEDVNRFLRGWAGYFRYGNSAGPLRQDQELRADAAGAVHRQTPPPLAAASAGRWSPTSRRTSSG